VEQLDTLLKKHPTQREVIVPQLEALMAKAPLKNMVFTIPSAGSTNRNYAAIWFVQVTKLGKGMASFDLGATRMGLVVNEFGQRIRLSEASNKPHVGSLTITGDSEHGVHLENQGDGYPPFLTRSMGAVGVFIANDEQKLVATHSMLPLGDGTIHRFAGKVELWDRIFEGEGDEANRLTFLVRSNSYYYLRGKGSVTTKDGKQENFGK
jgi:hypothetical protein